MTEYTKDMPIIAPCYIRNMPASVYHAQDCASNSNLRLVSRSPAHYKYPPIREATRAMVIGSALHCAVLEPDLFYLEYALLRSAEDRRCKEYKDAVALVGDEHVLVRSEVEKVEGIMNSINSNKAIADLLSHFGAAELSGFSTDPQTGQLCKHRFDKLLACGIGIDLKTTTDSRPDAFSRSIMAYNYHVQHAFYMDQYEWITDEKLQDFVFIVVESESPYAAKLYRIDDESTDIGRAQYRDALDQYAACRKTNTWPAYQYNEIEEIGLPQWVINKHDQQQIEAFQFTGE